MQQSARLLESAQLARRGWKAGQRANIDALTMQANYVLVRAWSTRAHRAAMSVEVAVVVVMAVVVVVVMVTAVVVVVSRW